MIFKIHGKLESLDGASARLDTGHGLTYEVLLPAFAASRLAPRVGQAITLHTVHYLEGSSQGANFTPRLAGFLDENDRAFFAAFTSVKGIGSRKALRAMTLSTAQIAAAIADRDVKVLQSMPEIGRRMAETIIATLHGKIDKFLSAAAYGAPDQSGKAGSAAAEIAPIRAAAREALEILLQLGENRTAAMQWIDQIMIKDPELDDPTRIVQRALHLRGGG